MTGALFIALFLNEDVPVGIAQRLRAHGYDAVTAQETGRLGLEGAEQRTYAVGQRRAILTHNRQHFALLHEHWLATRRDHYGIIAAFRRPPGEIVTRLLALLDQRMADEMRGQLRSL